MIWSRGRGIRGRGEGRRRNLSPPPWARPPSPSEPDRPPIHTRCHPLWVDDPARIFVRAKNKGSIRPSIKFYKIETFIIISMTNIKNIKFEFGYNLCAPANLSQHKRALTQFVSGQGCPDLISFEAAVSRRSWFRSSPINFGPNQKRQT